LSYGYLDRRLIVERLGYQDLIIIRGNQEIALARKYGVTCGTGEVNGDIAVAGLLGTRTIQAAGLARTDAESISMHGGRHADCRRSASWGLHAAGLSDAATTTTTRASSRAHILSAPGQNAGAERHQHQG